MGGSQAGKDHAGKDIPADAPAKSGTAPGAPPVQNAVVDVAEVSKTTGAIATAGRYSTTSKLEDHYKVEKKALGSGMSGPVQLATGIKDQRKYAVKSFKKKGLPPKKMEELKNEVEIYLVLDHPHVARLDMVFETDDEIDLVMECMAGGELYDRLSQQKQYTEENAAETTHMMLLAVAYLHDKKIAHRDLKLENFLYEAKDTNMLKLIDFGFAKHWDRSTKMSQACGSVHYVAPEVLLRSYTEKADCWSMGVIVYMLLTGSPPFHGTDDQVLAKIKAGQPQWSSRFHRLSEPAKDFTQKLLVKDVNVRLSAQDALAHPWITNRKHATVDIEDGIVKSLQQFAHSSSFKRAVLSMMAWSLTVDDRKALREQFLELDKEQKGTITHVQMVIILKERFDVDSTEAEALFTSLDTNNDGEINYSEFLAATLQGRVKAHEDVLRKTFMRFDETGSGNITADHLKEILGDSWEQTEVVDLIKEADVNKDGKISYDEFLAYFHQDDHDIEPGSPGSNRHAHIEKMAKVVDNMVDDGSALSPKTPKPLSVKKSSS